MSFSQNVKNKLRRIKETGAFNKAVLAYGIAYGERAGVTTDELKAHGFDPADYAINPAVDGDDERAGIFLRGVFLACGNVTDPEFGYHLELVPPTAEKRDQLDAFINGRSIAMKHASRSAGTGKPFLYSKDSEGIVDFLAYIGAMRHSIDVINAKILRELRNNVNRKVNCEAANIEKTARAAGKHLDDIEYIRNAKGRDFLPPELRETALIRSENPSMTLKEIGDMLKISKSGVNHRLNRISETAERIRKGETS